MNDPYVSCPYDVTHRVPRSRIQAHIVKCEKRSKLTVCPYNATHRLPDLKMKTHVLDCPSKAILFPEDINPKTIASIHTPKPILQKEYLPETDPNHEMWDD